MDEIRAKIAALEAELANPTAAPTKTWQEWVRMVLEILKMILNQLNPPVPNP